MSEHLVSIEVSRSAAEAMLDSTEIAIAINTSAGKPVPPFVTEFNKAIEETLGRDDG